MFKCSECGKTFNKKPDYCDCGNDEFIQEIENREIGQNKISNILSFIFLAICIILSVFILAIKVEAPQTKTVSDPQKTDVKPVDWSVFKDDNVTNEPVKKIEKKVEKNVIKQPEKKVEIKPVKKVEKKEVKNIAKKTSKKVEPKVDSKVEPKVVKKTSPEKKKTVKSIVKPVEQKVVKKETKEVDIKKELASYKKEVASVFYYKIDFTNVIGSGVCDVSFRIDSTGKVVNKSFKKQSTNTTLNDAVFNGVQRVNRVMIPPKYYDGGFMTLHVSIYNGSYLVRVD